MLRIQSHFYRIRGSGFEFRIRILDPTKICLYNIEQQKMITSLKHLMTFYNFFAKNVFQIMFYYENLELLGSVCGQRILIWFFFLTDPDPDPGAKKDRIRRIRLRKTGGEDHRLKEGLGKVPLTNESFCKLTALSVNERKELLFSIR